MLLLRFGHGLDGPLFLFFFPATEEWKEMLSLENTWDQLDNHHNRFIVFQGEQQK